MRIGFPRGLSFYDHYPFWHGFFQTLGMKIVVSQPTQRRILEEGLKKSHEDTCLPVKIFAGHIASFDVAPREAQVDAIFLPRLVSVTPKTYLCPKILGIPESVLLSVPPGLPVLTVDINGRDGQREVIKSLMTFGKHLGVSGKQIQEGYRMAIKSEQDFARWRRKGADFEECLSFLDSQNGHDDDIKKKSPDRESMQRPTIALIGHPYLIHDTYANMNLLRHLREKAEVLIVENVQVKDIDEGAKNLRKEIFWSHGRKIFGAGSYYTENKEVDGIIYLTCFGCGTDSMIQDMLARQAKKKHKPYMMITLDEHSGAAGMITRVEAFIDMLTRRTADESNLSAYG